MRIIANTGISFEMENGVIDDYGHELIQRGYEFARDAVKRNDLWTCEVMLYSGGDQTLLNHVISRVRVVMGSDAVERALKISQERIKNRGIDLSEYANGFYMAVYLIHEEAAIGSASYQSGYARGRASVVAWMKKHGKPKASFGAFKSTKYQWETLMPEVGVSFYQFVSKMNLDFADFDDQIKEMEKQYEIN